MSLDFGKPKLNGLRNMVKVLIAGQSKGLEDSQGVNKVMCSSPASLISDVGCCKAHSQSFDNYR